MKTLLFFFLCLFTTILTKSKADSVTQLESDRAALLKLQNTLGGRSILWNTTSTPCSWSGVICDARNTTVVELHLPGVGLSGQIPTSIGNLSNLQTLSLRFNALNGSLPDDLSKLTELRNLYLQGNFLSGEIPGFVFGLRNLVRLNLAGNRFSGAISGELNKLERLDSLLLEENGFVGSLPDLNVPPLSQFNVSFNPLLSGSIPSKLATKPASSFAGTSLCGPPLGSCNVGGGKKGKLSGGVIAGIVVACVFGFLVLSLCLVFCCVRKKGKGEVGHVVNNKEAKNVVELGEARNKEVIGSIGGGGGGGGVGMVAKSEAKTKSLVFFGNSKRGFELEDLLRASAEVLGKGTFGTTYKATLTGGNVVAVKRLKDVTVSEKEFREKIEAVGNVNHENLVPLKAYYYSRDETLLVLDYLPMGSLSALLHGSRGGGRTPLTLKTRSRIALGAARGIAFLHAQGLTGSHGNIKSSNILLTSTYEPCVSDYGLAQLAGPTPTPNRVDGYRAPEVTDARKVSQKADVYSFGVVLLELLTAKPPTHSIENEEGVDLPRWVQSVVKEEWSSEVFDIELLRYQNVEEEMVQLLQLALDCIAQHPETRPSMDQVTARIDAICHSSYGDQDHISNGIVNV